MARPPGSSFLSPHSSDAVAEPELGNGANVGIPKLKCKHYLARDYVMFQLLLSKSFDHEILRNPGDLIEALRVTRVGNQALPGNPGVTRNGGRGIHGAEPDPRPSDDVTLLARSP
jgi:hypothetical protein